MKTTRRKVLNTSRQTNENVPDIQRNGSPSISNGRKPVVVLHRISTVEDQPEEISEYERIRLENIKEREQMFEQLGLDNLKGNIGTSVKSQSTKTVRKLKENLEPVRKSRRLAGGVPEIQRFQASFEDHPLDSELVDKPRRRLAGENCNDYLHATRTFTGNEEPESLSEVASQRFKILRVPKKCTIKQFVLSNNLEFKTGRGFYEFTKPEIISHKKEVVLVDKKTGEMFSGRDACRMIGGKHNTRLGL